MRKVDVKKWGRELYWLAASIVAVLSLVLTAGAGAKWD